MAQPKSSPGASLVLTHATVIDVAGGRLQPDLTVFIAGNHITAIGKRLKIASGVQVIDAKGKYLIPGLWDMHVHSFYEGRPELFFPMFIANGVTGVREMASTMSLEQISVLRKQIEDGEVVAPRVGAVAGRILEGPVAQLGPEFEAVTDADSARQIVRSRKQKGADFIKVYNQLSRDVYFAIVDEANKQHISFAGHLPISVSADEASDAGQKSIEHLTRILPACSSRESEIRRELADTSKDLIAARGAGFRADGEAVASYDSQKASALFERFRRNGTWQCPTLVQLRKFVHSGDTAFINDQRLQYIPAAVRGRWRDALTGPLAEFAPYAKQSFPKQIELVGMMHAAGVPILAGTDSGWGNPYTFAGFSLHDELGLLVEAGLSPLEALQAATLNPAKFLSREKDLGTVEKGKLADLVLLDANPLENIDNTRKIAAVIINGRYLPRELLQKMLADVEELARKK